MLMAVLAFIGSHYSLATAAFLTSFLGHKISLMNGVLIFLKILFTGEHSKTLCGGFEHMLIKKSKEND